MLMSALKKLNLIILCALALTLMACQKIDPSFSLLATENKFVQSGDEVNNKIDILWVVDNSGSMETSQQALADNFNYFIQDFINKGFDFQMAVITTDTYKADFMADNNDAQNFSRFKDGYLDYYLADGDDSDRHGVYVMTKDTPNLNDIFIRSILQKTSGSADERPLQSVKTALDNTLNSGFVRQDSYFAVIFVTDEDDFSHDGSNIILNINSDQLHDVEDYVTYLDDLTQSSGKTRRYNFSSMSIWDDECLDTLKSQTGFVSQRVAQRVGDITDLTGGIKGSLCGDFGQTLTEISSSIIQLATQFYLDRLPVIETISVVVNGEEVPHVDSNNGPKSGGWKYDAEVNSIVFSGDYVPDQGSNIAINFDPATLKE